MELIPWTKKHWLLTLIFAAVFWIPALIMLYTGNIDITIQLAFNNARNISWLSNFFVNCSKYGSFGLFAIILIILLVNVNRKQLDALQSIIVAWIITILLAFLLCLILKNIFLRPRPFVVLGTQINNPITDSGFSFPSGQYSFGICFNITLYSPFSG